MNLATIVPRPLMELEIFKRRPIHMALAQIALKDDYYLSWFRQRRKEGKKVILDNGAYEGEQINGKELASLAAFMRPTWVVAPDSPNRVDSVNLSSDFVRSFGFLRKLDVGFMWILHGDPDDFESFKEAAKQARWLRCDIGFSRLTPSYGYVHISGNQLQRLSNRTMAWARLASCNPGWAPWVHAFGYRGLVDAEDCRSHGFHSLDTSAPVWRALNGYSLDDNWPDYPFDYQAEEVSCSPESITTRNLWLENLERLDTICAGKAVQSAEALR